MVTEKPVPLMLKIGVGLLMIAVVGFMAGIYGIQASFKYGTNSPLLAGLFISAIALVVGVPLTIVGLIQRSTHKGVY